MLRKMYYRAFIVFLSLRWMRNLCLGDIVVYNGKRYTLTQGVANPYWSLSLIDGKERLERIHRKEFKKERSVSNWIGSFKRGHQFYMDHWYAIWVHGGVKPWMRECKIWGKS